nr:hypothetical protein [Pandoravirus massiliensis]
MGRRCCGCLQLFFSWAILFLSISFFFLCSLVLFFFPDTVFRDALFGRTMKGGKGARGNNRAPDAPVRFIETTRMRQLACGWRVVYLLSLSLFYLFFYFSTERPRLLRVPFLLGRAGGAFWRSLFFTVHAPPPMNHGAPQSQGGGIAERRRKEAQPRRGHEERHNGARRTQRVPVRIGWGKKRRKIENGIPQRRACQ